MIPAGHANNPTKPTFKQFITHIHTLVSHDKRSRQASAYSRLIWGRESQTKTNYQTPTKLTSLWKRCGNTLNTSLMSTGQLWRWKCYITWFMSWIIRQGKVLRTPLLSHRITDSVEACAAPPSVRARARGHHDVYAEVCLLSRGLLSDDKIGPPLILNRKRML